MAHVKTASSIALNLGLVAATDVGAAVTVGMLVGVLRGAVGMVAVGSAPEMSLTHE